MSDMSSIFARTSTLMSGDQFLARLRQMQRDLLEEQRKVSTGKEVIRPSDEPSEAPAIFYLRQSLNAREQHHRNLDHAQGKIDLIDAALGESGDVLREAKTLASSQGGDRF